MHAVTSGTHGARLEIVVSGRVVSGRRLGRTLGAPTANLALDDCPSALHGSYAAVVNVQRRRWPAVAHLGIRPSVDADGAPVLEVHLLDFDGDLYGRRITVWLLQKVSDEAQLPSLEALERKIHDDVRKVRCFFDGPARLGGSGVTWGMLSARSG